MSELNDLDRFIAAAKAKGAADDFLGTLLKEQGWPARDVYGAIGRFYERETGLAVPLPGSRMESAREAFFYLLAFVTLASWAFAVGSIWFVRIEQWFADPLERTSYYWTRRELTFQLAAIFVAFPAFLLAMRTVLREQSRNPEKGDSGVRRWLTNLALFLTALILIGDLTYFLARFLGGGLSIPFALKSLVVSVIAGAIFWYYTAAFAKPKGARESA